MAQEKWSRYKSSAPENAKLVKTRAGLVQSVSMTNANAGTRYLQIFDVASAPANGDVPLGSWAVVTGDTGILDYDEGAYFNNGIYICASTTQNTLTLAGSDHLFAIYYN